MVDIGDNSSHSSKFPEYDHAVEGEKVPSEDVIARKETNSVNFLRVIVSTVLLLSTVGVACVVYVYLRNSEIKEFEKQFIDDSHKVLDAIGSNMEKTFSSLDIFATSMVGFAHYTKQEWPFVTIDNFAIQAAKTAIYLYPIVQPYQRDDWEIHSMLHKDWVNETTKLQKQDTHFFGRTDYIFDAVPYIYSGFGDPLEENVTRIMMPQWHSYPSMASTEPPFNWDYLSYDEIDTRAVYACIENHSAILSGGFMLNDLESMTEEDKEFFEGMLEYYAAFIGPDENVNEPMAEIDYPVIDRLDSIKTARNGTDASEHEVAAVLAIVFYWRDIIKNILPKSHDGLVIVFSNPCNPSFSYTINGPLVHYLGPRDMHDTKYSLYTVSSKLFDIPSFSSDKYLGAPIHDQFCPHSIAMYPSDTMKAIFTTKKPIILSISVVSIFVFVSVVFCVYDCVIEKRQKVVAGTAQRNLNLVSSLFPLTVRDRMINGQLEDEKKSRPKNRIHASQANPTKNVYDVDDGANDIMTTKPLADLYPDTTILFADIVGFTAWSSTHSPCDVFTLLETLYGAFDQAAKRRRVFKIETIGDCYVAVAGLPDPNPNHSVAMVRFANDCLGELPRITSKLSNFLGRDTSNLQLRIGLNSGPATAGVLRGEKARFQLFGDTVNIAARMESTGRPGQIHVSQATADLLIKAGKTWWLTEREDIVEVKGKGNMKTFWVRVVASNVTSASNKIMAP